MVVYQTPVASAEEPWHSRLSIASTYLNFANYNEYDNNDADDDDVMMELFGPPIDNRSHQCFSSCTSSSGTTCLPSCPDDGPLWWLVLRWMKMMLLKVARSYHAKPFLLVVTPLVVGLLVGYWLGGRRQQKPGTHSASQSQTTTQQHIPIESKWVWGFIGLFQQVMSWLWAMFFHLYSMFSTLDGDHRQLPFASTSVATPRITSDLPTTTATTPSSTPCEETITTTNVQPEDGDDAALAIREATVRTNLKSQSQMARESGVPPSQVPRHIAVIMDGNRRYGKARYGSAARGHWDGSSKLVEFATWCLAEGIKVLTVFAFSSENWNRDPAEIASLMQIFAKYCDELRVEALQRNIKIDVLSTGFEQVS